MLVAKGYGLSINDIDWSSPADMKPYLKAHKEELKERDYLSWMFGQYTLSAVSVAIEHNLAGRKAKSKYIEKPILNSSLEEKEDISYGESREEIAVFEMKIRAKKLRDCGFAESPM